MSPISIDFETFAEERQRVTLEALTDFQKKLIDAQTIVILLNNRVQVLEKELYDLKNPAPAQEEFDVQA